MAHAVPEDLSGDVLNREILRELRRINRPDPLAPESRYWTADGSCEGFTIDLSANGNPRVLAQFRLPPKDHGIIRSIVSWNNSGLGKDSIALLLRRIAVVARGATAPTIAEPVLDSISLYGNLQDLHVWFANTNLKDGLNVSGGANVVIPTRPLFIKLERGSAYEIVSAQATGVGSPQAARLNACIFGWTFPMRPLTEESHT